MAADGIVEAVRCNGRLRSPWFDPRSGRFGAPDEFGLEGLEERLDHGVVGKQFPLPDIEIEMPFFLSSAWYSMEQYWLPRSAW